MDRLTDERLDELENLCGFDERHGELVNAVGTGSLQESMLRAVAELRTRRAADLSDDERDVFATLRNCVEHHPCIQTAYWRDAALAALSKLLGER